MITSSIISIIQNEILKSREKISICGYKFSKDNDYPKHPKICKRILGENDY